ncbi:MAG: peptidoglycan DL-endopeptidase CwlO [Actinomycetota bacterium]|jgi:cell wall-associated NlpC family hydrolase|nr:peptidoglycan DL-endopeptidase CwlO [Actinomycetota bacterium]
MHISVAAGVAGSVAVTGTVVAVASDQRVPAPRVRPVSLDRPYSGAAAQAGMRVQRADLLERQAREEALARLTAARQRAKLKREKARKAAAKRAAEARVLRTGTSSRSFSRADGPANGPADGPISASAGHVLAVAAAAASGAYYVHGGDGPKAFDCSGFTQFVFAQVGISLPHQSGLQRGVARSVSSPAPGDLVFVYNGGGGSIGHVAIYAGGGYWYEASNPSMGVGKHRAWSTNVSYGRIL